MAAPSPYQQGSTGSPSAIATPQTDADKIKAIEAKVRLVMDAIHDLDGAQRYTIPQDCTYDVGAKRQGDPQKYIRRCKNPAVEGTNPFLCYQHARKGLIELVAQGRAEIMAIKKEDLRVSVKGVRVVDPRIVSMSLPEFKNFYDDRVNKCGQLPEYPARGGGGVYGDVAVSCAALEGAGFDMKK